MNPGSKGQIDLTHSLPKKIEKYSTWLENLSIFLALFGVSYISFFINSCEKLALRKTREETYSGEIFPTFLFATFPTFCILCNKNGCLTENDIRKQKWWHYQIWYRVINHWCCPFNRLPVSAMFINTGISLTAIVKKYISSQYFPYVAQCKLKGDPFKFFCVRPNARSCGSIRRQGQH